MCPSSTSSSDPPRRAAFCVVVFFLGTLTLTGLVDFFYPAPHPELVGFEKVKEDRLRRKAHLGNGSLARLVEHDLRLSSRVRRTFGPYYTLFLFRYLDEAQGQAVVGQDGWLFLANRTLIKDHDDDTHLGRTTAVLAALDRRLASLGVDLIVMPVPRKSVVYRDFLARGVDPRADLDERLPQRLAARGVSAVDLLEVFRQARRETPDELLYFQTDSHWTETAQLLAAETLLAHAGRLVPEDARRGHLLVGRAEQERDNLDFIGLQGVPERALDFLSLPSVATYDVPDSVEVFRPHKSESAPRLAVVGTSFTARRKLPAYLAYLADEPLLNAALAGVHPLESLISLLENREDLPETALFELPAHNVFGHQPLAHAGNLFAASPPATGEIVLGRLTRQQKLRQKIELQGRLTLGRTQAGAVVHSGDGVAAIRLRGSVRGHVEVVVEHAGSILRGAWPAGQEEVVLPLIAAQPTGAYAQLRLEGEGQVRLQAVDAVTFLDKTSAVQGRHTRLKTDAEGWLQTLRFPDAPEVHRHAALILELDGVAQLAAPLTLVVQPREGQALTLALSPVGAQATLVVSLSPLRGRHLVAVELRGQGPKPATLLRRGRLLVVSRRVDQGRMAVLHVQAQGLVIE
jgi:hypothetical protein